MVETDIDGTTASYGLLSPFRMVSINFILPETCKPGLSFFHITTASLYRQLDSSSGGQVTGHVEFI